MVEASFAVAISEIAVTVVKRQDILRATWAASVLVFRWTSRLVPAETNGPSIVLSPISAATLVSGSWMFTCGTLFPAFSNIILSVVRRGFSKLRSLIAEESEGRGFKKRRKQLGEDVWETDDTWQGDAWSKWVKEPVSWQYRGNCTPRLLYCVFCFWLEIYYSFTKLSFFPFLFFLIWKINEHCAITAFQNFNCSLHEEALLIQHLWDKGG